MRRVMGWMLAGLGVFMIVLALLLATYVEPRLAKTPFDPIKPSISEGQDVLRYNAEAGEATPIPLLRATRTVVPDVPASSDEVVVYNVSVCIMVVRGDTPTCASSEDDRLVSITTDRVASDRKTGFAVNAERFGESLNGDTSVEHEGLSYKFPFGTEKKSYPYFDTTLAEAFPMEYKQSEEIDGLRVYRFEQQVPAGEIEILEGVPGTYENVRTVWVEPTTGVIIRGREEQVRTFSEGDLAGQVALQGRLEFTEATVANNVETAKDAVSRLRLIGSTSQLLLTVFGGLLLLVGLALSLLGQRRDDGSDPRRRTEGRAPEPAVS